MSFNDIIRNPTTENAEKAFSQTMPSTLEESKTIQQAIQGVNNGTNTKDLANATMTNIIENDTPNIIQIGLQNINVESVTNMVQSILGALL